MKLRCLCLLSLSLGLAGQLWSEQSKWQFKPEVHGFASLGFVHSSEQDYLVAGSSDGGSFELFEAGLNVSNAFSDSLHTSVQLLSRDFGEEGNHDVELDFAYADFRWMPELGFRLGKARLPLGLYNEYRDIDASRDAVFLNQNIYSEEFRPFLNAYQGLGIYGTSERRGNGWFDFEYQLFAGKTSIPDDFFINRTYAKRMGTSFFRLESEDIVGGKLVWNSPFENLRLGYSYAKMRGDMSYGDGIFGANPFGLVGATIPGMEGALDMEASQSVVSMEFTWGRYRLVAEQMNFLVDAQWSDAYRARLSQSFSAQELAVLNMGFGRAFAPFRQDMSTWYVQLDADLGSHFYPFLSYGELYEDKSNKGSILSYRKDITLGFRYQINDFISWKLEHHWMNGHGILNDFGQKRQDARWNVFLSRVGIDF